jgi:hypothetical protein
MSDVLSGKVERSSTACGGRMLPATEIAALSVGNVFRSIRWRTRPISFPAGWLLNDRVSARVGVKVLAYYPDPL